MVRLSRTIHIDLVDNITIMKVDPGFAGQRFLESTLNKITALRHLREEKDINM